jgi:hypothetical protein
MDDVTLSAIDTSRLVAVDNALDQFVSSALGASAADWTAMRSAAEHTVLFPDGDAYYNFRDLGDFMEEVAGRVSSTTLRNNAAAVSQVLDDLVFAATGSVAEATGLSIYMPYGSTPIINTYTAGNYSFLAASTWDDFLTVL